MATNNDNKQLGRQVAGLFGDTLFALIVGVVCLFIFGAVVALIWDLVNKIL
jgi:phosphotransferase system  glucose/maltose/N-acetylglucosamine-specific IIC component